METKAKIPQTYASTRNACKLCSPLGASMVFKGIQGCLPMLHGSQGCATYIRRYMISHFKEPVDIASSNFSEESTIFGGNKNFCMGIDNIISQYNPAVIGIASTCLSETIGENIPGLIQEYQSLHKGESLPYFVHASTPSYQGSHIDGFHEAVLATISALAQQDTTGDHVNIFPGFVSPEDLRHLKDVLSDFGIQYVLFPDYSDSLDNPHWGEYQLIPDGGTPIGVIKLSGSARATIEFGSVFNKGNINGKVKDNKTATTAGEWLEKRFLIKRNAMRLPIGIDATDEFFKILEQLSGQKTPAHLARERGRLIDSYVDSHKYLFGKRAMVYGEEDLVIALTAFLSEVGIEVVLAASGGDSGLLKKEILEIPGVKNDIMVVGGMDFEGIADTMELLKPDLMIGNSKGYYIARKHKIPLVRVGFPIHDRAGAQRVQHLCYKGTQQLFDRITNALIEYKQDNSPVGWKYV